MKVRSFRIVKDRLAEDAFTGEGAGKYGGRWNSSGAPIVYTASTISLAMLEMLVYMQSSDLMRAYVVFPVTFDDSLVTEIDPATLPRGWRASPVATAVQQLGDDWIASGDSAVLRVPSAIVDDEANFLLNPKHRGFSKIKIGKKQSIDFDRRLK